MAEAHKKEFEFVSEHVPPWIVPFEMVMDRGRQLRSRDKMPKR